MATEGAAPKRGSDLLRALLDRELRDLLSIAPNLRGLVRLASPELAARLDFDRMEPIPLSFLDVELRERVVDVLARVPYRDDSAGASKEAELLIYILVEHESAEKPLFPEGVLAAITRIYAWDRRGKLARGVAESELRLHVVVPILFYTGARSWHPLPTMLDLVACPPAFEGFVPRNDLLVVSLQKTPKEALLEADRFFGAVLRLLQARGAPPEEYRALLGQMVRFLDDLRELDQPRWYRLAGSMLTLSLFFRAPEEHATLEEVVVVNSQNAERAAEVRTMAKTIAESLLEQGWKGGLEEGRAVGRAEGEAAGRAEGEAMGRAEGKAETLVRLLARRFGPLPAGLADRIRAVRDEARLDAWLDLVLSARSREEMGLP